MNVGANILSRLKEAMDHLLGARNSSAQFQRYIVTPRQGRHTIRRKLLRQIPVQVIQSQRKGDAETQALCRGQFPVSRLL